MQYKIIYTEVAATDITEKFLYITKVFRDRALAQRWYARLKEEIQKDLSFMPAKYALYNEEPWHTEGVRLFLSRQDVVLYSCDEKNGIVYIRGVCTRGRDLNLHMEQSNNTKQ